MVDWSYYVRSTVWISTLLFYQWCGHFTWHETANPTRYNTISYNYAIDYPFRRVYIPTDGLGKCKSNGKRFDQVNAHSWCWQTNRYKYIHEIAVDRTVSRSPNYTTRYGLIAIGLFANRLFSDVKKSKRRRGLSQINSTRNGSCLEYYASRWTRFSGKVLLIGRVLSILTVQHVPDIRLQL